MICGGDEYICVRVYFVIFCQTTNSSLFILGSQQPCLFIYLCVKFTFLGSSVYLFQEARGSLPLPSSRSAGSHPGAPLRARFGRFQVRRSVGGWIGSTASSPQPPSGSSDSTARAPLHHRSQPREFTHRNSPRGFTHRNHPVGFHTPRSEVHFHIPAKFTLHVRCSSRTVFHGQKKYYVRHTEEHLYRDWKFTNTYRGVHMSIKCSSDCGVHIAPAATLPRPPAAPGVHFIQSTKFISLHKVQCSQLYKKNKNRSSLFEPLKFTWKT